MHIGTPSIFAIGSLDTGSKKVSLTSVKQDGKISTLIYFTS